MVFGIERSNYYPFECPSCPNNTVRIEPLYDPVPTCLRNLSHFSSPLNYEIGPLGEQDPGPVGITLGKALCLLKEKRAGKKSLYVVARNRLLLLLNIFCLALPGCCLTKYTKTFSRLCIHG